MARRALHGHGRLHLAKMVRSRTIHYLAGFELENRIRQGDRRATELDYLVTLRLQSEPRRVVNRRFTFVDLDQILTTVTTVVTGVVAGASLLANFIKPHTRVGKWLHWIALNIRVNPPTPPPSPTPPPQNP